MITRPDRMELVTAPSGTIVTATEAKLLGRVTFAEDDALFAGLLEGVSDYFDAANGVLGRALRPQSWKAHWDTQPQETVLQLPFPPLTSVSAITYFDTADTLQTFAAVNYRVIASPNASFVELVSGQAWPSLSPRMNAFTVAFSCGTTAPDGLKVAAMQLAVHWYDNGPAVTDREGYELPMATQMLIAPHRLY